VSSLLPSPAEIRSAAARIAPLVLRTPLVKSTGLSDFLGGEVWLKLECEQETGSFKIRGAANVIASLPAAARAKGVVASSAGNHGLGIAAAARAAGIAATVFVPRAAPAVKRDRIEALGATIDVGAVSYDAAEQRARAHAARTGATFVSPCTGRTLLAGQGTVALEVMEELPGVRTMVAAVGGGGLAGGIAGMLGGETRAARLVGAQSARTNAMTLAFASGKPTMIPNLPTLADGLAGLVDAEMLAQGREALDDIVTVSEDDIASAIAFLWIEDGLRVEGAGAAPVAALLTGAVEKVQVPLVVVVSGGNIDEGKHLAIIDGKYNSK